MQAKFELPTPTTIDVDHAKGRKEHHGEAKVLALDLSLSFTANNRVLDMFDTRWRTAFFTAVPPGTDHAPDQADLDLAVSDLPFLRMPNLNYPFKPENYEPTGYKLILDYGRGGDSDKIVNVCKLKGFEFTPIEGGSVKVSFKLTSAADIDGNLVGIFTEYIQQKALITLLAPVMAEGDLIDGSKDGDAPGTEKAKAKAAKAGKGKDATDAFVDAHGTGGGTGSTAAGGEQSASTVQ